MGAGGGTLYGLNENKKHDESYRNAYAACMHSRGYTGEGQLQPDRPAQHAGFVRLLTPCEALG